MVMLGSFKSLFFVCFVISLIIMVSGQFGMDLNLLSEPLDFAGASSIGAEKQETGCCSRVGKFFRNTVILCEFLFILVSTNLY